MDDEFECKRCRRPVVRNRESYAIFEQMHWVCFHYEFEHFGGDGDPDEACGDPSCPARAFDPAPSGVVGRRRVAPNCGSALAATGSARARCNGVESRDARVLGIHPVEGVDGCFLIEAFVSDATTQPDFSEVTQSRAGRNRLDWQVAYDERLLDLEGESVQSDLFLTRFDDWPRDARVAFFFHDLDIARPLSTPFGEVSLPTPSTRPMRLAMLAYDAP